MDGVGGFHHPNVHVHWYEPGVRKFWYNSTGESKESSVLYDLDNKKVCTLKDWRTGVRTDRRSILYTKKFLGEDYSYFESTGGNNNDF